VQIQLSIIIKEKKKKAVQHYTKTSMITPGKRLLDHHGLRRRLKRIKLHESNGE